MRGLEAAERRLVNRNPTQNGAEFTSFSLESTSLGVLSTSFASESTSFGGLSTSLQSSTCYDTLHHHPVHHVSIEKSPHQEGFPPLIKNNVCLLYSDTPRVRRRLTSDVSSPTLRVRRRPFSLHCEQVQQHVSSAYR
jgi:hypothetical protein